MAGTSLTIPRSNAAPENPMIRRQRGGKLEAVSWDEALDYVATRLSAIKAKYGPDAIKPPAPPAAPVMKPTM